MSIKKRYYIPILLGWEPYFNSETVILELTNSLCGTVYTLCHNNVMNGWLRLHIMPWRCMG